MLLLGELQELVQLASAAAAVSVAHLPDEHAEGVCVLGTLQLLRGATARLLS